MSKKTEIQYADGLGGKRANCDITVRFSRNENDDAYNGVVERLMTALSAIDVSAISKNN